MFSEETSKLHFGEMAVNCHYQSRNYIAFEILFVLPKVVIACKRSRSLLQFTDKICCHEVWECVISYMKACIRAKTLPQSSRVYDHKSRETGWDLK